SGAGPCRTVSANLSGILVLAAPILPPRTCSGGSRERTGALAATPNQDRRAAFQPVTQAWQRLLAIFAPLLTSLRATSHVRAFAGITSPNNKQLPSDRKHDRTDKQTNHAMDQGTAEHPDQYHRHRCAQAFGDERTQYVVE